MILVVDDDPLVQRTCQLCLEPLGYKLAFAGSGTEAMERIASNPISLMLIDVFMPDMDGIETLLCVKKRNPAMPIIVMSGGTARPGIDFLDVAMKFGADQAIAKPFTAKDLIAVLSKYH